ncbi:MAG: hypothetical protein ACP5IZ_10680 [Thermoprotei archaeon]
MKNNTMLITIIADVTAIKKYMYGGGLIKGVYSDAIKNSVRSAAVRVIA